MERSSAEVTGSIIERERVAVYLRAGPPLPAWYWPFFGIGTGVLLASNDLGHPWVPLVIAVVFALLTGAVVAGATARQGMVPRLREMPPVIRRPLYGFMLSAAVLIVGGGFVLAVVLTVPFGFTILGSLAAILVGAGGWLTSRISESRARCLGESYGIER